MKTRLKAVSCLFLLSVVLLAVTFYQEVSVLDSVKYDYISLGLIIDGMENPKLSEEDSELVTEEVLDILGQAKMRRVLFPYADRRTNDGDGFVFIDMFAYPIHNLSDTPVVYLKLGSKEYGSFIRINDEKYYKITNAEKVFEDIYSVIEPYIEDFRTDAIISKQ